MHQPPFRFAALLLTLGASGLAVAQDQPFTRDDWNPLAQAGELDLAKELCVAGLNHSEATLRAEAHICLFNLAISKASGPLVISTPDGEGIMRETYRGPQLDTALVHLDSARLLTPTDVTIHQARQHVLLRAMQYDDALEALEEALSVLDVPADNWFDYTMYYYEDGRYEEALAHLQILESHYSDDPRVIADVGAFLMLLDRNDEAEPYLARAVELTPEDPINLWNLARFRVQMGDYDAADDLYRRAFSVDNEGVIGGSDYCTYAVFLEEYRGKPELAAAVREEYSCETGN